MACSLARISKSRSRNVPTTRRMSREAFGSGFRGQSSIFGGSYNNFGGNSRKPQGHYGNRKLLFTKNTFLQQSTESSRVEGLGGSTSSSSNCKRNVGNTTDSKFFPWPEVAAFSTSVEKIDRRRRGLFF